MAWTPIGNGAYTTANAMTGPAFQGTFDGQGHAVRNLKIVVPADAAAGSAWGLFGVLKGATVRNLTIGEGSSVVSTAAAMTAVGAVAGYAYEATIENCENRAAIDIQGGGDNVRESAGGIVGAICANENDSHILSCTNYGKITSKNSVNTKNGATGFSIRRHRRFRRRFDDYRTLQQRRGVCQRRSDRCAGDPYRRVSSPR